MAAAMASSPRSPQCASSSPAKKNSSGSARAASSALRGPSSPSSLANAPVLLSSRAHNEQGSGEPASPSRASGRSRSPFKRQREDRRGEMKQHSDSRGAPAAKGGAESSPERTASSLRLQQRFDDILASREIPAEIRARLSSLNPAVKESLIRNQAAVSLSSLDALGDMAAPHRLREAAKQVEMTPSDDGPSPPPRHEQQQQRSSSSSPSPTKGAAKREAQQAIFGSREESQRGRDASPHKSLAPPRNPSPTRPGSSPSSSTASPDQYARMLLDTSSRKLDIARLRRLRVLLCTESPSWLADFLFTERGYEAMLRRIGELIELEWRDEVHDDKALHELLRGLVALGATDRGRLALSSLLFRPYLAQLTTEPTRSAHLPTMTLVGAPAKELNPPELPVGWERHPPFGPLTALLLSDRKPGDINTRKLIVELLGLLPHLTLPQGLKRDVFDVLRSDREVSACYAAFSREEHVSPAHLLLLLLHNPISPRSLSLLPFISQSHHPRPFKSYLLEISCAVRDYFWIFCHGQNRYYDWQALGEGERERIDGPSVPGGMTGGVEFEAIKYITAHLKLINRIASLLSSSRSSKASVLFHVALFDSGLERLLLTLRRASQQYYGSMHLALAHYLHLAMQAGYKLSSEVQSWFEKRLQLRNAMELGKEGLGVSFDNMQVQVQVQGGTPFPRTSPARRTAERPSLPPRSFEEQTAKPASSNKAQITREIHPPSQMASFCKENAEPSVPQTAKETAVSSPDLPASSSQASSAQGSLSGHWLRQNATALLVASSISSESFFNEAWPTEEDAVACGVPLPASPIKAERERANEPSKANCFSTTESRPSTAGPAEMSNAPATSENSSQFGGPSPLGSTAGGRGEKAAVVVGTARERIRLWEGRANASTGSGVSR